MAAEQLRQTVRRPQEFHMAEKGTGTPGAGPAREKGGSKGAKQPEAMQHPLVRVFELGEKLIREGKMTREQFAKMIEPFGYEGPDVGP